MARDFGALLSDEQKRDILKQHINMFAAEAFQHEINRETAVQTGNEAGVAQADEALGILDLAITVREEELAKLDTPTA